MKLLILLLPILLLPSCTTDIVLPECKHEYEIIGNEIELNIISESEFVLIEKDNGTSLNVHRDYFGCISLDVEGINVITITDSGKSCEIIIN